MQTAFQVGGAITLAVVTAVINAATPRHRTAAVLASYHPALAVVPSVALLGLIATVSISGLRRPKAEVEVAPEPEFAQV